MSIPTVVHQLWKTEDTPQRYAAFRESWLRRNPSWTLRLWTDRDLAELVEQRYPELLGVFHGYAHAICRADLGRYLVLERFGGVYADLDCECLRPLSPLLEGASLLVGQEPDEHLAEPLAVERGMTKLVCPSFIASIRGHPFWQAVRGAIAAAAGEPHVIDQTGPCLLTRTYDGYEGGDVTLAPAAALYPFTKSQCWSGQVFELETWERATRGAFVAHYWDSSWWRQPTPLDGLPWTLAASLNTSQTRTSDYPSDTAATKITCLTVVADEARASGRDLEFALESFRRQTHANRELLIVSRDPGGETAERVRRLGRPDIAIVVAPSAPLRGAPLRGAPLRGAPPPGAPVSDEGLLAFGARHAAGSVVCRWDAGELHDPRRLEVQFRVLRQAHAQACVLTRGLAWRPGEQRLAITAAEPQASSLMWSREATPEGARSLLGRLLGSVRVAAFDLPKLKLTLSSGADFEATWDSASARFEGDRCEAVVEELGKRLPVAMARTETPHVGRATRPSRPGEVVILTPIKDGRRHLPRYFELLERLDAGGAPLSIGFLEGDSRDGSFEALGAHLPGLKDRFDRVVVRQHHDGLELRGPRWAREVQRPRRAAIARARNRLLAAALGEAEWALWLDADVADYPPDLLQTLLGAGKDIVAAHCIFPTGRTYDLNTFILDGPQDGPAHMIDGLVQPPRGVGRRYLEDVADQDLVRVDGVGGTALLVRAQLHRDGLNFPAYSHGGYIETEGLAMMARDLGYDCWAMPKLRIVHHADAGVAAPSAKLRAPDARRAEGADPGGS